MTEAAAQTTQGTSGIQDRIIFPDGPDESYAGGQVRVKLSALRSEVDLGGEVVMLVERSPEDGVFAQVDLARNGERKYVFTVTREGETFHFLAPEGEIGTAVGPRLDLALAGIFHTDDPKLSDKAQLAAVDRRVASYLKLSVGLFKSKDPGPAVFDHPAK